MEKKWFKVFEIIALSSIIILVGIYIFTGNKQNDALNAVTSVISNEKKDKFYGLVTEKGDNYIAVSIDYNSSIRNKVDSIKLNVKNSDLINVNDKIKVIYTINNEDDKNINIVKIEKVSDDALNKIRELNKASLESLPMDYSIEQATEDGDYIYYNNQEINGNVLDEFIKNIKAKENTYIRIIQKTTEDKIIIIDVDYCNDAFSVLIDTRRDDTRIESERKIYNYTYTGMNSYDDLRGIHLYLYNGFNKVNKDNFNELDCLLLGFRIKSEIK